MNPYSSEYNLESDNMLQYAIMMKNSDYLHFPQNCQIKSALTDMDHFPYRRFFRGVYNESEPVIFGRQAGYRSFINPGCSFKCSKN